MNLLPSQILNENINKKVKLHMRKDKMYTGILKEFDEHGNIYMEDVYEINEGNCSVSIGNSVINGGTVAMIDFE